MPYRTPEEEVSDDRSLPVLERPIASLVAESFASYAQRGQTKVYPDLWIGAREIVLFGSKIKPEQAPEIADITVSFLGLAGFIALFFLFFLARAGHVSVQEFDIIEISYALACMIVSWMLSTPQNQEDPWQRMKVHAKAAVAGLLRGAFPFNIVSILVLVGIYLHWRLDGKHWVHASWLREAVKERQYLELALLKDALNHTYDTRGWRLRRQHDAWKRATAEHTERFRTTPESMLTLESHAREELEAYNEDFTEAGRLLEKMRNHVDGLWADTEDPTHQVAARTEHESALAETHREFALVLRLLSNGRPKLRVKTDAPPEVETLPQDIVEQEALTTAPPDKQYRPT